MKSGTALGNRTIHPMVIPFPGAFLTGSVALDIASRVLSSESLYRASGPWVMAVTAMGFAFPRVKTEPSLRIMSPAMVGCTPIG